MEEVGNDVLGPGVADISENGEDVGSDLGLLSCLFGLVLSRVAQTREQYFLHDGGLDAGCRPHQLYVLSCCIPPMSSLGD